MSKRSTAGRQRWGWYITLGVVVGAGLLLMAQAQQPQQGYAQPQQGYAQSDQSYAQPGQNDPQQPDGDLYNGTPAADPPAQVARLSQVLGNVSLEPASVDQFTAADLNTPLTTGDRIYADVGANAELETDTLAVRLGQATDLTVTALNDTLAQFGLASGSVHLRSYSLAGATDDTSATIELDTPNVAVTVLQPGDIRVDVDPNNDATIVTVLDGEVQVNGNGMEQVLTPNQRARFTGSDPVLSQWMLGAQQDGLDQFSADRDAAYQNELANEQQDVAPDVIGAADLAGAGDWESDDEYGPVWYPTTVAVGWVPYSCGHWTWVAPWGWTWIDCAPWGFAPFHYGRWVHRGPRWGWIPGSRYVRPIYAPALVTFVAGREGVTAWFPLGPGEIYRPWYRTSPVYLNRVNVTNIYESNPNRVREAYNQRSLAPGLLRNSNYANRMMGTVAVQQSAFAAGRPVAQGRVPLQQGEFASAPILEHPRVAPERSMIVPAPARAVPRQIARPMVATREEDGRSRQQQPGNNAPSSNAPSSSTPSMNGLGAGMGQSAMRPGYGENREQLPNGSAQPYRDAQPNRDTQSSGNPQQNNNAQPYPPNQRPVGRPMPVVPILRSQEQGQPGVPNAQPNQPNAQPPIGRIARPEWQPNAQPAQQPNPQPSQQPPARPLFNRTVPPPPRPSFEQQQRMMQNTAPGRPPAMQPPPPPRPAPMPRFSPPPRPTPPPAPSKPK